MGRKKIPECDILSYCVKTRINAFHHNRLHRLMEQSRYRTMSDLLREIVCNGKITIYTKDESLGVLMPELVKIRKELNAIGNNINQITRQMNSVKGNARSIFVVEALELYRSVDGKIDQLSLIISSLAKLWLQK